MNKSEDVSGLGQGTSTEYEITGGHCVSPPGNRTKERGIERRKAGEMVERRTRRILEGHHLAEDSANRNIGKQHA